MQDSKKEPHLDVNTRKKNLTLDLHATHNFNTRRSKLEVHKTPAPVLSSPDLQKLGMKTPELESLILQHNSLTEATPTPNATQVLAFPKIGTEEQERFSQGFQDALHELKCSDSSQGANQGIDVSNSSSNNSIATYTDLDPSHMAGFPPITSAYNTLPPLDVVIKDEPQTVPNMSDSPNLSPIDMENQEIIKLERKRMRNRVAASKCRRRKLEKIARLEEKVKVLKGENSDLSAYVVKLKDVVCDLKRQVLQHVNSGCQIMNYC